MQPYVILKKAGFEIIFTGIVTEKVMDALSLDSLIGSFVDLEDASDAVGRITNAYKKKDVDLTILLTHIGFESDVALARMLDPEWGVDMIIGGHSHTLLERPAEENGVLVVPGRRRHRPDRQVRHRRGRRHERDRRVVVAARGHRAGYRGPGRASARGGQLLRRRAIVDKKYGAQLT